MSSHQLDPRSMEEAQSVSNVRASGSDSGYLVRESAWVVWVQFAAVMLILLGSFHVIEGLVAIFRDEVFVTGRRGLLFDAGFTTWGWAHVVWGVIAILAGVCLLAGQTWARLVAVAVSFVSAIVNLAFLPAYPIWSVMMIGFAVVVIWAVMVHGGELRRHAS